MDVYLSVGGTRCGRQVPNYVTVSDLVTLAFGPTESRRPTSCRLVLVSTARDPAVNASDGQDHAVKFTCFCRNTEYLNDGNKTKHYYVGYAKVI
ncbi:hypothetical protein Taro_043034 [Colocasia esculenta]|uniref:Uncharacterized protein n=1 Tax=Colocasia esculenta TaxID=4460 RepID=A0A843WZT9_COLES|nr:hypothetical protein [Colocasia esculenta]